MGKSVWDLTVLLEILTGYSYQQYTEAPYTDLSRYRIGVPRKHFGAADTSNYGPLYSEKIKQEAEEAFERVVKHASPVLDPADIYKIERLWEDEAVQHFETTDHKDWGNGPNTHMMKIEYFHDLNAYLARRGCEKVPDMAALVKWNAANPVGHFFRM